VYRWRGVEAGAARPDIPGSGADPSRWDGLGDIDRHPGTVRSFHDRFDPAGVERR